MATRDGAYQHNQLHGGRGVTIKWDSLSQDDEGEWRLLAQFKDKCLHVFGDFSSAQVVIEGTNEDAALGSPANSITLKSTLTDPMQQDLFFSAPVIRHVLENPMYIRPRIVGGDVDTDITVILLCRN